MSAKLIVEFRGRDGQPIALQADIVESIIGENEGCTVVTKGDTHRVTASYAEALAAVWPERLAFDPDRRWGG